MCDAGHSVGRSVSRGLSLASSRRAVLRARQEVKQIREDLTLPAIGSFLWVCGTQHLIFNSSSSPLLFDLLLPTHMSCLFDPAVVTQRPKRMCRGSLLLLSSDP